MGTINAKKKTARLGYAAILVVVLVCLVFELVSTYRLTAAIDLSNRKIVLNYANQTAARL